MPEPIITPAAAPTVLGLSDPDFAKNLDAAFAQAQTGAKTFTPPPVEEPEPEDVLQKPPPEPKPAPEPKQEPEPKKATTKSEQWKELHRLRDDAEKRAKDYEQKIKDYETRYKDFDPDKIKRIQSERDDFEARLKAFAVEHDPQFEEEVKSHMSRIKLEAENVLGDKASRFVSLLGLPESDFKRQQLAALTEGMDEYLKFDIAHIVREHRQLQMAKQERVNNSRQNWQKMMEAQTQQAEKARNQILSQFEDTLRQWQDPKSGIAPLQMRDGDDQWNNDVRQSVDLARNILSGQMPPQEFIRASLWAASAPRLLSALNNAKQEAATLKAELEALRKAEPRIGGGGGSDAPPADEYKGLSYGEVIAKMAEREGGFSGR